MRKIKVPPKITSKRKIMKSTSQLKRKKDRAYIVGGGPSINIPTLSKLSDGDIIAVNKSIEYFNRVDFFVTIDYSFLSSKTDFNKLKQKADNTVFIVNRTNKYIIKAQDGFYYDSRFKLKYEYLKDIDFKIESRSVINPKTGFGLSYSQFANGENSGFCAIQLAILMGYKEIFLLGFDLKTDGTSSHFHSGYKNNTHFRKNLLKYQKTFDGAFQKLSDSLKMKIISCSKKSYLNKYLRQTDLEQLVKKNKATNIFESKTKPAPATKKVKVSRNSNLVTTKCLDKKYSDLLVVGYFTINTPYEQEKEKLVKSIRRFGLASYIKGIPNQGDWQKNTRYKAIFLKEVLEKFPDKKILYVDADAEFLRPPELFIDYDCDIAIRWQTFRWRENESLSGTIYLESNEKTKLICDKWIKYNDAEYVNGKTPTTMEQWNLGKLIKELEKSNGLKHKNLPATYCSFDHIRTIYPEIEGKEVIVHYQASRRFKTKVKK
jgi:hypothetical protein